MPRGQMCTKPAKVGRLASTLLNKSTWVLRNEGPPLLPPPGLRSVGGPKLLIWGLFGRGANLLKSDRPLTSSTPGWEGPSGLPCSHSAERVGPACAESAPRVAPGGSESPLCRAESPFGNAESAQQATKSHCGRWKLPLGSGKLRLGAFLFEPPTRSC